MTDTRAAAIGLASEMSLREPQAKSLERLDLILQNVGSPLYGHVLDDWKRAGLDEGQGFADFDGTAYPSFAFHLATAVGKTKLMGAATLHMHRNYGVNTFLIVAPSRTIYRKLKEDFAPGTRKFVFAGLTHATDYQLVHGENYEFANTAGHIEDPTRMVVCVFNIQKLYSGRGTDRQFVFRQPNEDNGRPFADMLQARDDLVLMLDESHRYRADASAEGLASLEPMLGLEFTATPRVERTNQPFRNVIYRYDLNRGIAEAKRASADVAAGKVNERGYMKIPKAIARSNDYSLRLDLEENKLIDGLTRHLRKKALLAEHCSERGVAPVLPLTLLTAPDINVAGELYDKINDADFMGGKFVNKVINVNTGLTASDYESAIERLVQLESPSNTQEVVIHVEQLKEGWDVRTVYTIIPFRASVSMTLIEQTIGRGLRLPFGRLTGNKDIDQLEIISHARFEQLLSERGDSEIEVEASGRSGDQDPEPWVAREFGIRADAAEFPLVPVLRYEVTGEDTSANGSVLDGFNPQPTLQDLTDIQATLIEQDLHSGEEQELGAIERDSGFHPVWHLVALLDRVAEVDLEADKEALERAVSGYLTALTKSDALEAWMEPAGDYEDPIITDLAGQLRRHVSSQVRFGYADTGTSVTWTPFTKALPGDGDPVAYTDGGPIKRHVFGGYAKSLYTACAFDSDQEKQFADLCERDPAVAHFIRLPIGRFPVMLRTGRYNPDFVVEFTDGRRWVVEVKERPKIEDRNSDVAEKARAAEIWCAAASAAGHGEWTYRLFAHDAIARADNVAAIPPARIPDHA